MPTAGDTAVHDLTINRRVEAPPDEFLDDADAHYPGVFFQTVGNFPEVVTRGKHGECTFTVRIYYVGENQNNTRPRETGRLRAIQIMENIEATDRLELEWADSVEWLGLLDDPFTQRLHLWLPRFYAGCTVHRVTARGLTF